MFKEEVKQVTGSTKRSLSLTESLFALAGDKSALRSVKRRLSAPNKRKHTRYKTVWLCECCVSPSKRIKKEKKLSTNHKLANTPISDKEAKQIQREAYKKIKQEDKLSNEADKSKGELYAQKLQNSSAIEYLKQIELYKALIIKVARKVIFDDVTNIKLFKTLISIFFSMKKFNFSMWRVTPKVGRKSVAFGFSYLSFFLGFLGLNFFVPLFRLDITKALISFGLAMMAIVQYVDIDKTGTYSFFEVTIISIHLVYFPLFYNYMYFKKLVKSGYKIDESTIDIQEH